MGSAWQHPLPEQPLQQQDLQQPSHMQPLPAHAGVSASSELVSMYVCTSMRCLIVYIGLAGRGVRDDSE